MMPQTTPPPVGLCVQDLTVRYGTAAVLQGVSFSVPVPGQLIGLLAVLLLPDIARIRADAVGRDRAQDQEIATLKARLAVLESGSGTPAGTRVESPPAAPAVFPARTEEVVTCPRCGRRQKGNRASCYACGLPFRYEQE